MPHGIDVLVTVAPAAATVLSALIGGAAMLLTAWINRRK